MGIDDIFSTIDIAVSGLRAQNKQMEIISSNVANARTTDAGNGQPYRRLEVKFNTDENQIGGVNIEQITQDLRPFTRIYDPGNPAADEQGYVLMPNVNLPVEMMNLTLAARAYQANVAILRRYQQVVETALELLR